MKNKLVNGGRLWVFFVLALWLVMAGCIRKLRQEAMPIDWDTVRVDSLTGKMYDGHGNFFGIAFIPKTDPLLGFGEGINGSTYYDYEIDTMGKRVKQRAFKYHYRKEDFRADINNDTIVFGEDFEAYISFANTTGNVAVIRENGQELEVPAVAVPPDSLAFIPYTHRVATDSLGVRVFAATLYIDGIIVPITYKYVVVPGE